MAENKPQPVQPPIDPKQLMAAALFSTPEGRDYLSVQTELNELQLADIKERRQSEQNRRNQLIQAKAAQARAEEAKRLQAVAQQSACTHRHENGRAALGGQRFARGGIRDWVLRCQLCGREFDDKHPVPPDLKIAHEAMGGPNF